MYCLSHFTNTYTNLTLDIQTAMLYNYRNPSTSLEPFGNAFCRPFSFDGGLELTAMGYHSGMLDGCCGLFGFVECLGFQCFLAVNLPVIDHHASHWQPLLLAVLYPVMRLKFSNSISY